MIRRLTGFENAWAEAALAAIFPGSREDGLAGIGSMDVRGYLRDAMRRMPLKAAVGMRVAVWLVALAPIFVLGRLATIARLAAADRERVIARLVSSGSYAVRSLVLVLKTMGALLYAGDDAVRSRILKPLLRAGGSPSSSASPALVSLRVSRAHVG
jgi:hypothetical protein